MVVRLVHPRIRPEQLSNATSRNYLVASKTYNVSYTCATTHAHQMRRVLFGQCKGGGPGVGVLFNRKVYLFLMDAKLLLRDSIYKF